MGSGVGHGGRGQGTRKVVVTRRECDQVAIPSSKGAYWGEVGLGLGLRWGQGGWGVGCEDRGTKKVVATCRECDQVAILSSKGAYWGEVGLGLGV
jgi:hypothetical protein